MTALKDQWQNSKMTEKQQIMGCCWINDQVFKCLPLSSTFLSLLLLFLVFLSASFCLTIVEIQRRELMDKQTEKKKQTETKDEKEKNETCIQDRQKCQTPEMRWSKTWAKDEGSSAVGCLLMSRAGGWRGRGCGAGTYGVWSWLCLNPICRELRLKPN